MLRTIVPSFCRPNRPKGIHKNYLSGDDKDTDKEFALRKASRSFHSMSDETHRFVFALVVVVIVSILTPSLIARSCFEVEECNEVHRESTRKAPKQVHVLLAIFVGTLCLREMLDFAFAYTEERDLRLSLVRMPPRLSTTARCLSFCLFVSFAFQVCIASGFAWVHVVPPIQGFKESYGFVHSLQFVVWQVKAPIFLVLCGHFVLQRPLSEVSLPAIASSCYMYLAWWALIVDIAWLRCCLVTCCFSTFAWTSCRMLRWVSSFLHRTPKMRPSRRTRTLFLVWLCMLFTVYGAIYLLAMFDFVGSQLAYDTYAILDSSVKVVTFCFLAHFRSVEQRDALANFVTVQKRMSRASLSILRSSFDYLLPCKIEQSGECYILGKGAHVEALERVLQRSLANVEFSTILYSQRDKDLFKSHAQSGFQQEKEDLIREASAPLEVFESEWRDHKWFQESPAVASGFNYELAVAVSEGTQRSIPVSIHLSSARGYGGKQDGGPKMMIAMRLQREAIPIESVSTFGNTTQNRAFWDTRSVAAASRAAVPGEVKSETIASGQLCNTSGAATYETQSGVQSSLQPRLSSISGSALQHLKVGKTTPSVNTFDSSSSSSHRGLKPQVHDVATETSVAWDRQGLSCKCRAKSPSMPDTKDGRDDHDSHRSISAYSSARTYASGSLTVFNGTWLLDDQTDAVSFLRVLKIKDGVVLDADGTTRKLLFNRSTAKVMYEGGTMSLKNGRLNRIGRSGVRYCYDRAPYQCQSFFEDQIDSEITPLFESDCIESLCLTRDDGSL